MRTFRTGSIVGQGREIIVVLTFGGYGLWRGPRSPQAGSGPHREVAIGANRLCTVRARAGAGSYQRGCRTECCPARQVWTLPRDVAPWHWPVYGDGPPSDMQGSIAVRTPADPAQDRTPLRQDQAVPR